MVASIGMTGQPSTPVLYTSRVEPALAVKVARIASTIPHFATDFMGRLEEGVDASSSRLEASQDPDTRLWQIDRITRLSGAGNVIAQKPEIRTGLCFFDALHYLARFQSTEADMGKQIMPVTGERWTDVPHYKQAAEAAGQAIDADGAVHPCAHGRILSEGFFDDTQYRVAATTKNMPLIETANNITGNFTAELTKDLMRVNLMPGTTATDYVELSINRLTLAKKLKDVTAARDNFGGIFRDVIANHFKPEWNKVSITRAVYTMGLHTVTQYVRGNVDRAPIRSIYKSLGDFNSTIEALPECAEKTLLNEFSKACTWAIPMERAAEIFAECIKQEAPPRHIQKGLRFIHEAARIIDLGPADTERLKLDYLGGKFVRDSFRISVRNLWANDSENESGLLRKIEKRIAQLENNQPA